MVPPMVLVQTSTRRAAPRRRQKAQAARMAGPGDGQAPAGRDGAATRSMPTARSADWRDSSHHRHHRHGRHHRLHRPWPVGPRGRKARRQARRVASSPLICPTSWARLVEVRRWEGTICSGRTSEIMRRNGRLETGCGSRTARAAIDIGGPVSRLRDAEARGERRPVLEELAGQLGGCRCENVWALVQQEMEMNGTWSSGAEFKAALVATWDESQGAPQLIDAEKLFGSMKARFDECIEKKGWHVRVGKIDSGAAMAKKCAYFASNFGSRAPRRPPQPSPPASRPGAVLPERGPALPALGAAVGGVVRDVLLVDQAVWMRRWQPSRNFCCRRGGSPASLSTANCGFRRARGRGRRRGGRGWRDACEIACGSAGGAGSGGARRDAG